MKILQIGKFYPPHMGGIETHLQTLCEGLSRSEDLRVVVANDSSRDQEDTINGVRVERLATKLTLAAAPLCPSLVSRIRSSEADIVHLHLPNPGAVLAYLASGHLGPLVVTYHSDTVRQRVLGPLFEPFLQRLLRRANAIITTTSGYQQSSPSLKHHQDRCHVVPLGIPLTQFAVSDPRAVQEIRGRYGKRIVLSVGRQVYYKGFRYLIEAMIHVDGQLVLIGEGPLRGELEQAARGFGVANRIHFLGMVPSEHFSPYYHASDIFVLPSIARSEAFGIVQIEAMAAGVPVINTQLDSGVPFVSLHGQTGLTVPPADTAALAAAISTLLDDNDLRARYGAAGRMRAKENFSDEVMVKRTLDTYEIALSHKN